MINLETITKEEIVNLAKENSEIAKIMGGLQNIESREHYDLKSLLNMYFVLNTEVGCFFGKNGF